MMERLSSRGLWVSLALVSLAVVSLSGCDLIFDVSERPSNRCTDDSACDRGACDPELGMCVADPEEPYRYAIAVTLPADGSGRPRLTDNVAEMSAANGAMAPVVVRRTLRIDGTVRTTTEVIEADLLFRRQETRVGAPIPPVVASTASSDDNPLARDNDFATELFPGTYEVEVRPRGEHAAVHPPFRFAFELGGVQHLEIQLPGAEAYLPLGGWVVDAAGEGIDGLEVRAIEVGTGRRVSSVARTATEGGQPGAFSLHVDPGAGRWVFQVSAPADSLERSAFPTLAIDPSVLVPVDLEGHVQLLVPSPDSGRCFAGSVELPGSLGAMQPAVGASITLRGRELRDPVTGIVGSFTVQLVTSSGPTGTVGCSGAPLAAGGFETRVLPGTYDIEIRPLEASLGIYVGQVVIGESDQLGQIFQMPARTVVGGRVQRAADLPMPGAQVRALPQRVPLPDAPARVEALLNRAGEVSTDATGRFSLPLDVGVYDLVVEPPSSSGFPWWVLPGYAIGGSTMPLERPVDLRIPAVVRGLAMYEDGTEVAGATIEVYAIVGVDGLERSVPIGRATTEPDGSFLLLLPPAI